MFLIIVLIWKRHVLLAAAFVIFFGSLELLYFSACLAKVHKGGWLSLIFSVLMLSVMCIWHYGTLKKYSFEVENKLCLDTLLSMATNLGINRVPGVGLIYSDVVSGVPPMFGHFITNFPAFHQILIFVTLQTLPMPKVPASERFQVSRIGPPDYCIFRCIVRYGYKDARKDSYAFESHLLETVAEFVLRDTDGCGNFGGEMAVTHQTSSPPVFEDPMPFENEAMSSQRKGLRSRGVRCRQELEELLAAREAGVAYMMGNTCVIASEASSHVKKFLINVVYAFLRKNSRRPALALGVPHTSLIEVGMVYHV